MNYYKLPIRITKDPPYEPILDDLLTEDIYRKTKFMEWLYNPDNELKSLVKTIKQIGDMNND